MLFRTIGPPCGLGERTTTLCDETSTVKMNKGAQLGVHALSAVPQLSDDKIFAVSCFGKFICVMTGYAGGEFTSQIVISRPLPVTNFSGSRVCMELGTYLSNAAEATMPDASSTMM